MPNKWHKAYRYVWKKIDIKWNVLINIYTDIIVESKYLKHLISEICFYLNLSFDCWHFEVTSFETILDSLGGSGNQDSPVHIINSACDEQFSQLMNLR